MSTKDTTHDQIRALLAMFGNSPEQIAEDLRALGIYGIPGDGEQCPIANYLRHHSVDGLLVLESLVLWDYGVFSLTIKEEPLPPHIKMFIERFDNGEFEFLQLPEA